jgi:RNA polymerase sigma factor (sigma-70 family)
MVIQRVTNKNTIECNKCSWETVKPGERNLIRFFSNIPSLQSKNIEELLDRSIYMNKEHEPLYNYESLININETLIKYIPKNGVFPSKIDYRWCYNCISIEPIFLDKPFEYEPKHFIGELKLISSDNLYGIPEEREVHNHIAEYSFDELKKEQTEAVKEIQELEKAKEKSVASSIFFRFSSKHNKLFALRRFLNKATEVLNKCEKKNKEGKDYYKNNKSKPRCLRCSLNDVSDKNYLKDSHYKCGGSLKEDISQVSDRGTDEKPFANIRIEYDKSGKLVKGILTGGRFVVEESDRLQFNNQSTGVKIDEKYDLHWEYNDEIIKNYQNLQDYTDLNPLLQIQTNRKKSPGEMKLEESIDQLIGKEPKGLSYDNPKEIERDLDTLTPREADVVRLYYGLGNQHAMTLEEIGETFDLTRERVKQIKEKAIRRLKHTSRSTILKKYFWNERNENDLYNQFMEDYGDYLDEGVKGTKGSMETLEVFLDDAIRYTLQSEEMRELKKEIGLKAYIDFIGKVMDDMIKNKEIPVKIIKSDDKRHEVNDDTSDNNERNENDLYNQFIEEFNKGSRNKRLCNFASDLIDKAKKGQRISDDDLNTLIEAEINDINSYPTDMIKIYDNNPEKLMGAQVGYLLFIKIDIDFLAKFLNKHDNNRFDGFDDIEQYHAIFTAVYNKLAIKLGYPPLPTQYS